MAVNKCDSTSPLSNCVYFFSFSVFVLWTWRFYFVGESEVISKSIKTHHGLPSSATEKCLRYHLAIVNLNLDDATTIHGWEHTLLPLSITAVLVSHGCLSAVLRCLTFHNLYLNWWGKKTSASCCTIWKSPLFVCEHLCLWLIWCKQILLTMHIYLCICFHRRWTGQQCSLPQYRRWWWPWQGKEEE